MSDHSQFNQQDRVTPLAILAAPQENLNPAANPNLTQPVAIAPTSLAALPTQWERLLYPAAPSRPPILSQQIPTAAEGPEALPDEEDPIPEDAESEAETEADDELGILRLRERPVGADLDLGVIRIREIDELPPEPVPSRPRSIYLTARAGAFGNTNLFRTLAPEGEQVYRVGAGLYAFPAISDSTTLIAGIEGNLVRYGQLNQVNYNELQIQAGVRQRLSERTFGQLSWRNQRLYVPGGDEFFQSNFAELLLSRRDILSYNTWLDSYYQARFSFSEPDTFSRFSQSVIASLNYGFTRQFRATLVYQLFLDDYTQIERYDTYHQVLGQLTYDLSPSSRVNLFTGYRFGRSSLNTVNFDDFVYGASYSVSLPLF